MPFVKFLTDLRNNQSQMLHGFTVHDSASKCVRFSLVDVLTLQQET